MTKLDPRLEQFLPHGPGRHDSRAVVVMGSPRSGNTLMAQCLAAGFDGMRVLHRERHIFDHRRGPTDPEWIICKRPRASASLGHILDAGMWVIWMVRDPRDVITSHYASDPPGVYRVNYPRWRFYQERVREFVSHSRVVMVRFEDLVLCPQRVQFELKERLELRVQLPFEACYARFESPKEDECLKALNGVRPLDPDTIGRWPGHPGRILRTVKEFPELLGSLVILGYEEDHGWYNRFLQGLDWATIEEVV